MKKFKYIPLTKDQKKIKKKVLEISFEQKLSHIGSCLKIVDIIDTVFTVKGKKDNCFDMEI